MTSQGQDSKDDVRRAASDASSLIRARTAARREESGSANEFGSSGKVLRPSDSMSRSDGKAARHSSANGDRKASRRSSSSSGTRSRSTQGARGKHGAAKQLTFSEYITQNAVYIVGVAAVAAIVAVLLIAVKSCVPTPTYDYDGELDFDYESPYVTEDFDTTSDHYAYVEDGTVRSRLGVDVSENQDEIDWEAVKADGVEFAIIRLGYRGATEGVLHLDARFAENLAGAQAAGLDCGVYFFSQAKNEKEAKAEADFVIKSLDGAKLVYPVAYDFEEAVADVAAPRASGLGKDQMTKNAKAFCERIEEAGYRSIIYGNYYDLNLYHYKGLKDMNIWWAEYDVVEPNPHLDIDMWQYTSVGWVNGITTPVDMNLDLSGVLAQ